MGCKEYLVNALQVSMDIFTPTCILMQQCGWLTVKQLMAYHSLMLLDRTLKFQTPAFMFQRVSIRETQSYQTRHVAGYRAALIAAGVTDQAGTTSCKLEITRRSWCWASIGMCNKLHLT